jgi:hypothetical protein
VIYPGSTPVGNATLVVANMLTCNKHTPISLQPSALQLLQLLLPLLAGRPPALHVKLTSCEHQQHLHPHH